MAGHTESLLRVESNRKNDAEEGEPINLQT